MLALGSRCHRSASPIRPCLSRRSGFWTMRSFRRIHRTVIEGMPVFPGGAWHSREPWLELMEEATAVAAQALPLYSPPRAAELPTVKEVQSAVRETSGSTRNLRKRHLVQRFVDSIS